MYNRNTSRTISSLVSCILLLLAACGGSKPPAIQDLAGHENLSLFKLYTLRGTRDGDRLHAQAVFTDSSSMLTMEMHFAIGSPTTLESGSWRWSRNNRLMSGSISARSVTFLGGQDGPPSIGGIFDLRDQTAAARYRVNLPVTALPERWRPATN